MPPLESLEVPRHLADIVIVMQHNSGGAVVRTSNNIANPLGLLLAIIPVANDKPNSAPLEDISAAENIGIVFLERPCRHTDLPGRMIRNLRIPGGQYGIQNKLRDSFKSIIRPLECDSPVGPEESLNRGPPQMRLEKPTVHIVVPGSQMKLKPAR